MSLLGVLTGIRGEVKTCGIFHKGLRIAGICSGHPDLTSAVVSLNLAVLDACGSHAAASYTTNQT